MRIMFFNNEAYVLVYAKVYYHLGGGIQYLGGVDGDEELDLLDEVSNLLF